MSGIYKSRLFNFLNRQKIRFTNQLGITLRHLQLVTETGVKILLYPVYIIVRTSISVRRLLQSQAASSTEFELTTESDSQSSATQISISRDKISAEDDLWLEFEDNNLAIDTSKTDALSTLAASEKATSGLSLQRQNNSQMNPPIRFFQKMLDWVKTSPVATRLNLFGEASIVPFSPVNETVSQPEKNSFFSNLLDRLGLRSSNRSQLAKSSHSNILTTESSEQDSLAIQVLIRRAIAYFFGSKQQLLSGKNQKVLPSTESQETATIQLSQVNLPVVNSAQSQKSKFSLLSRVNSWLEKVKSSISRSHSLTTESSEQESLAIQVLIRRAIAHFFGSKQKLLSGKKQAVLPSAESQEPATIQLSQVNSWLNKAKLTNSHSNFLTTTSSAEDSLTIKVLIQRAIAYFLGKKHVRVSNNLNSRSFATLPFSTFSLPVESNTLSFTLPFNSWNLQLPGVTEQDFCLPENSLTQNPSCLIVTANFLPTSITEQESITVTSDFNDSLVTNIPLEFSSDLWEAEVVTVGYVKNLLEKILEVLDKITWWIEKQFLKLWQFFKKILSM